MLEFLKCIQFANADDQLSPLTNENTSTVAAAKDTRMTSLCVMIPRSQENDSAEGSG